MDVLEGVEDCEWYALTLAVGNQIMSKLGKEEICLPRSRKIRNSISGVKHHWTLRSIVVWLDGKRLVVSKVTATMLEDGIGHWGMYMPGVMEDNLPRAVLVNLDVVRDDLNLVGGGANELGQERTNDGLHSGRQDDNGDVFRQSPLVKRLEARVELDVIAEHLDAFWEGQLHAVEHVLEGIPIRGLHSAPLCPTKPHHHQMTTYLNFQRFSRISMFSSRRLSLP